MSKFLAITYDPQALEIIYIQVEIKKKDHNKVNIIRWKDPIDFLGQESVFLYFVHKSPFSISCIEYFFV